MPSGYSQEKCLEEMGLWVAENEPEAKVENEMGETPEDELKEYGAYGFKKTRAG